MDMVEVLALPSAVVRISRKLKPWFGPPSSPWHLPLSGRAGGSSSAAAAKAGVVPMALLKQRVDINLTADTFWVHHDAQVGGRGLKGAVAVGVGVLCICVLTGWGVPFYKRMLTLVCACTEVWLC